MPDTAFFRPELFGFLRQLKRHNNRDWFAKNKARYEEVVQDPALLFIGSFGPHLHKLSPHFVADPRPARGSLFRIYRDTRFSPDKRPFKTHVGIHFSHASGKDAHAPVFYLHLEPGNCLAAAGVWHPDNSALTKIRMAIVAEPGQWAKARRNLELEGDSLMRPPRGFDPNHRFIEDLKRKDFVASVGFTEAQVCGPRLVRDFAGSRQSPLTCDVLKRIVTFLRRFHMNHASLHEPSIARQRFIEPNGKNFSLTPLEKQIVALVLAGYTSKESGQRIGVSEHSVRQHLRDIIAKLGVSNRLELVLFVLHHHLIDPVQISPCVTEVRLSRTLPPRKAGCLMSRAATKAVGKGSRRPQPERGRSLAKASSQHST